MSGPGAVGLKQELRAATACQRSTSGSYALDQRRCSYHLHTEDCSSLPAITESDCQWWALVFLCVGGRTPVLSHSLCDRKTSATLVDD